MANSMVSEITLPDASTYNVQNSYFGTCSSTSASTTKSVVCSNFSLGVGNIIVVQFSNANTNVDTVQLNVNNTTNIPIFVANAVTSTTNPLTWNANDILTFIYDGTAYRLISAYPVATSTNNDTPGVAVSTTQPASTDNVLLWINPSA